MEIYLCDGGNTYSVGGTGDCLNPASAQRTGYFCDPQWGAATDWWREDLSEARSWQLSQEFRIASKFSGPLNFSFGGNFLHYETEENYYVFINSLSLFAAKDNHVAGGGLNGVGLDYIPGVTDNHECMPYGLQPGDPKQGASVLWHCGLHLHGPQSHNQPEREGAQLLS